MNLKRFVAVFLAVMWCGHAFAETQDIDKELSDLAEKLAIPIKERGMKKVTVLDFTDLQGGSSELGKYIAEQLTVSLVIGKRDFTVLDRANLKSILAEHKLTATGLVDPENAKKLGMFAGVDAIVLGTIIPKGATVSLTAKIITTEKAEVAGAARAEFKSDETVQQLLAHPTAPADIAGSSVPISKPLGDLLVIGESVKFNLSDPGGFYGLTRLTFVITNTSSSKTIGVGFEGNRDQDFHLSNSRGDEFSNNEIAGVGFVNRSGDGPYYGQFTDIPPRNWITVVVRSQYNWGGQKSGDFRPYSLQAMLVYGVESKGRYGDFKSFNLLREIK